MSRLHPRAPSPALVVSLVALIVALGGTSYAAFTLPKNSVGAKQIKNGAVTTKKIKNGAVTGPKMNLSGVTVPNASHANSAGSATNASHASTADTAQTLAPPEAFHIIGASGEPAFENVWVALAGGGSTPGFYKDQLGVVHLRGEFKNGTSSNTSTGDMFTLPTGYRPAENQQFRGGDASGSGNIAVLASGEVRALSGAGNALLSVDGFTFRAGA